MSLSRFNRRHLLTGATTGAIATAGWMASQPVQATTSNEAASSDTAPEVTWRMATSWPPSIDTLYGTAEEIAERVSVITKGQFIIQVSAAGELVPGLQVLDAVQSGTAQCGHSAAYYYVGKSKALAFSTALPFGFTARQQNAWFYQGGGIEAMNKIYAKFNTLAFPAGNTGVQMGGWFKQEVNSLSDLQGLKMRTAGLGGEVFSRLGVNVQALPAGEILLALELGTIDAAEWVGPYDDEKLGLQDTAPYYYYPSWWEPGASLDLMINQDAWNALPLSYQQALVEAAAAANASCLAKYDARNPQALERLLEGGTELRRFSDDILQAATAASQTLFEEYANSDADFQEIYAGWKEFRNPIQKWHSLGELDFLRFANT